MAYVVHHDCGSILESTACVDGVCTRRAPPARLQRHNQTPEGYQLAIDNYWSRRVTRRTALRGAGVGIAGLAGAALLGCGGGADEEVVETAITPPPSRGKALYTREQ